MNALHKYVVREMDATERRNLIGLRDMHAEAVRDQRNEARQAIARYKRGRAKLRELNKRLREQF